MRDLALAVLGMLSIAASAQALYAFNPQVSGGNVDCLALQPDGKVVIGGSFATVDAANLNGIARLNADGTVDPTFVVGTGVNGTLNAIAIQTDGKLLIGGDFISYNGVPYPSLARLNADGSLDTAFDPGTGPNRFITALILQPDGRVLVGGEFVLFNGGVHNGVVRLNSDGSTDSTLDTTYVTTAGVFQVSSLALQPDGRILVGGHFSMFGGVASAGIARIHPDGSFDSGFDTGGGISSNFGGVECVALQPDGKVLIGGWFDAVSGTYRPYFARLAADGTLESAFGAGNVLNGTGNVHVKCMALQPDGKVFIGGFFNLVDGVSIGGIARLGTGGSIDMSFDPSGGANSRVRDCAVQPDGKIIIVGGFGIVGGTFRMQVARLLPDGTLEGPVGPSPVVTGVSPDPVIAGAQLTISGTNLDSASSVTVGGSPTVILSNTSAQIIVDIGAMHTLGPGQVVAVATPGGTDNSQSVEVVAPIPMPTVTNVFPDPVTPGANLTIAGTGLDNAVSVAIGGIPAAILTNTAVEIAVTVSTTQTVGAGQTVSVTTPGGTDATAKVSVVAGETNAGTPGSSSGTSGCNGTGGGIAMWAILFGAIAVASRRFRTQPRNAIGQPPDHLT